MNEEKTDNSDDMPEFFLEKEEQSESSKKNVGENKSREKSKLFKRPASLLKKSTKKELVKSCLLYTSPSPRDS